MRQQGNCFFIDETWVNVHHTKGHIWWMAMKVGDG